MIVIGIDPGAANTGFGVVRTVNDKLVALDGGVIVSGPMVVLVASPGAVSSTVRPFGLLRNSE